MELTEFSLKFTEAKKEGSIPVIIVAAGESRRMNGISKQFAELCGIPAVVHTLLAFERSKIISDIILVTREEFIADMSELAIKYGISKLTDIVKGGQTRQESVANGLGALKNQKYALIHDGARPFVSEEVIGRVVNELPHYDCVICAVPVKDTVKKVNPDNEVVSTVDRSNLVLVQTPQGVNVVKYTEILKNADVKAFTDDASVFENAGLTVKVVEGDPKNFKITTREDLLLAQYYLEKGGPEI